MLYGELGERLKCGEPLLGVVSPQVPDSKAVWPTINAERQYAQGRSGPLSSSSKFEFCLTLRRPVGHEPLSVNDTVVPTRGVDSSHISPWCR